MTEEHADIAAKICLGALFVITLPIWILPALLYTFGNLLCDTGTGESHFIKTQKDRKPED